MKRKRYSVEQIVAAVKRHELGTPAADIARKRGIAQQTIYRWRKQYGGWPRPKSHRLRPPTALFETRMKQNRRCGNLRFTALRTEQAPGPGT